MSSPLTSCQSVSVLATFVILAEADRRLVVQGTGFGGVVVCEPGRAQQDGGAVQLGAFSRVQHWNGTATTYFELSTLTTPAPGTPSM